MATLTKKEYKDFISLVKRMREAQEREAMLSFEEDEEFVTMICVEARKAERKVDALLEKEQGFKSDKHDSFICFGGNTEGSAGIVHGDARMLNAIIVKEMFR